MKARPPMSHIRRFYQYSWARFIAVVVVNFVLTYSTYYVSLSIVPYSVAYSIAFAVGLVFTTIGNVGYTFSYELTSKKVILYGIYYIGFFL